MANPTPRSRRPAKLSRWAASGLTAAVTVSAVAAMTESAENDEDDITGTAIGAVARYEGEVAAAALMTAADPGGDDPTPIPPPRIGGAGVS